MFIFSLFFYSNFIKFCALFIEFLFPHDISLQGKILPHSPPPQKKTKKNPLKTTVHFPITIIICKHWSKFVEVIPKDVVIMVFDYAEQNGYLKFWSADFSKRMSVGGGLGALQFFWSLKKGTRTFHFR